MAGSAFETLVRTHAPAVQAYARALTNDAWLAEEAVQETFVRAWKYQDSFRGTGSYEGWLLRICRNALIDLATKRPTEQSIDDMIERPVDGGNTATTAEIGEAMSALPPAQREVLTLCGVLGYDYDSAAELLGIPVGTVRSRLHRGRAALDQALGEAAEHAPNGPTPGSAEAA